MQIFQYDTLARPKAYLSGPGKMLDKRIGWFAKIEIHNGKKGK